MKHPLHGHDHKTTSLLAIPTQALRQALAELGEQPYRAGQIRAWIYRRQVTTFEAMSNLPKETRMRLADSFHLYESTRVAEQSARDGTRKLLLRWADENTTECVLIPDGERRTGCISTQVGCPVGCVFCASGLEGVRRDLTAGQIVEQALCLQRLCARDDVRLTNVVFMGLGEPLANYDSTVAALRALNAEDGLGIGARRITVSTVGLAKQMRRLAEEGLQVTLALSLHAPTDELRGQLIPWARGVKIAELVEAARYYFDRTGREVTLEYVLLAGINDSTTLAEQLAKLCGRMRANVNLIGYNAVEGLPYERPSEETIHRFQETLRRRGVNVHLRKSRGTDIDSACGQLRRRHKR